VVAVVVVDMTELVAVRAAESALSSVVSVIVVDILKLVELDVVGLALLSVPSDVVVDTTKLVALSGELVLSAAVSVIVVDITVLVALEAVELVVSPATSVVVVENEVGSTVVAESLNVEELIEVSPVSDGLECIVSVADETDETLSLGTVELVAIFSEVVRVESRLVYEAEVYPSLVNGTVRLLDDPSVVTRELVVISLEADALLADVVSILSPESTREVDDTVGRVCVVAAVAEVSPLSVDVEEVLFAKSALVFVDDDSSDV